MREARLFRDVCGHPCTPQIPEVGERGRDGLVELGLRDLAVDLGR